MHGIRDEILPAGQDFPHGTHLCGDVLDAVDDPPVLSVQKMMLLCFPMISTISSFRHRSPISSKCSTVKWMMRSSFGWRDIHDPSAPDMFPQEHAEIGGGHGSRFDLHPSDI